MKQMKQMKQMNQMKQMMLMIMTMMMPFTAFAHIDGTEHGSHTLLYGSTIAALLTAALYASCRWLRASRK